MNLTELADDLASKVEAASDAESRREAIKAWLLAQKETVLVMYEEENQPLVRNKEAPGDLKVGDYVFASRWGDCHPCDPWAIGKIADIRAGAVAVGGRFYPYARRISFEQGDRIAEHFPTMEKLNSPPDYAAIAAVFGAFPDE
jgi:hypothetical protein